MTAELERYQPPPPALAVLPAGGMGAWADEFGRTVTVAAQLARTRFCPESLWVWRNRDGDKVYDAEATALQVAAAIATGHELGLSPMSSLRSIDVINGTPALRAVALRAVLLAHGHDMWVEEATNTRATVAGQRAGSTREQRITWTMDDAKTRNLAGKPNWRQQPRNMLIARATGDVARLIAADALLGIPYTVEELEDGAGAITAAGAAVDAEPQPVRRARRPRPVTPAIAATDEPDPDDTASPAAPKQEAEPDGDEPAVDEPSDDTPDEPAMITPAQLRRLQATAKQLGADRDARLRFAGGAIGRRITSFGDLTADEASHVLDAFDNALRERQADEADAIAEQDQADEDAKNLADTEQARLDRLGYGPSEGRD